MSRLILDDTGFKVGIFSPNCSSGLAVTKVEQRWGASWDDNVRLARIADDVGIDFLLPIARWIGYGGDTNFHEGVLDPTTWAAGLLAGTERISVFATIHTAFTHPVVAAKQLATIDQIGHGRAGVNIVAGWNQPEYETMGLDLPRNHDDRYALAQEWWQIVSRIWNTPERFDHDGQFWHLQHVEGMPKPVEGALPVLNAGSSAQGRNFAARNANFAFTVVGGPQDGAGVVRGIKDNAQQTYGRDVGVITLGHVVCRDTQAEAEEYYHWYADENADWDAVDNLMRLQGLHAMSFTPEMLEMFRGRFAGGHGSIPLIGTPDVVAEGMAELAAAGFDGMTVAFLDYAAELPYFAAEVLPRLAARGIRA